MYNSKQVTWLLIGIIIVMVLMLILITTLSIMLMAQTSEKRDQDESTHAMELVPVNKTSEFKNFTYYKITREERDLLAKLVHCEASICTNECKYAVLSVVFNRLDSGKWGKTLEEVIYYKNAFTPATFGLLEDTIPTKADYAAVDYVVKNGPTVPTQVRYFRSDYDFTWDGYENYIIIDNVYFGYFTHWQKGVW